jgi:hypothetical protein
VVLHEEAGLLRVAGGDGPGDAGVILGDGAAHVPGIGAHHDVMGDDAPDRLQHQLQHPVAGQRRQHRVEVRVPLHELLHVVFGRPAFETFAVGGHGAAHGRPVWVPGRFLGQDRFGPNPRVEQLGVRGSGQVVVERGDATQVGGIDPTDARTTARAPSDGDQPLHLQEPQAFAQRLPADAIVLEHRGLVREGIAGLEALGDDVAHEVAGDHLRRLRRAQHGIAERDVERRPAGLAPARRPAGRAAPPLPGRSGPGARCHGPARY